MQRQHVTVEESSAHVVSFRVCGKLFTTTVATLHKHKPNPDASTFLTALADPYWDSSINSNSNSDNRAAPPPAHIDRSPALFEAVLHFLRHDSWVFPAVGFAHPMESVFDELDYFGYAVPATSTTLAWHRRRREAAAADRSLIHGLPDADARERLVGYLRHAFEQAAPLLILPPSQVVEGQLGDFGLPGLKVKLAEFMNSPHRFRAAAPSTDPHAAVPAAQTMTIATAAEEPPVAVDDAVFAFVMDPAHAAAVKRLAHTAVFGGVVRVKHLAVSVTVGAGAGGGSSSGGHPSAALDYHLALSDIRPAPNQTPLHHQADASHHQPQHRRRTAMSRESSPPARQQPPATKVTAVEITPVEVST
jgi:hypothetical protein